MNVDLKAAEHTEHPSYEQEWQSPHYAVKISSTWATKT